MSKKTFETGKYRSLLSPNWEDIPLWGDLMDAVEVVFDEEINIAIEELKKLRFMDEFDGEEVERQLLIRIMELLGFNYFDPSIFQTQDLLQIATHSTLYNNEKGYTKFLDFISFSINADMTIIRLWTEDFVNLVPEGDPSIGTPVWEGGTWYLTSTVQISYDAFKFQNSVVPGLDDQGIVSRLFYAVAPANLVLKGFILKFPIDPTVLNFGIAGTTYIKYL